MSKLLKLKKLKESKLSMRDKPAEIFREKKFKRSAGTVPLESFVVALKSRTADSGRPEQTDRSAWLMIEARRFG